MLNNSVKTSLLPIDKAVSRKPLPIQTYLSPNDVNLRWLNTDQFINMADIYIGLSLYYGLSD